MVGMNPEVSNHTEDGATELSWAMGRPASSANKRQSDALARWDWHGALTPVEQDRVEVYKSNYPGRAWSLAQNPRMCDTRSDQVVPRPIGKGDEEIHEV